jgi:hypothetical protein
MEVHFTPTCKRNLGRWRVTPGARSDELVISMPASWQLLKSSSQLAPWLHYRGQGQKRPKITSRPFTLHSAGSISKCLFAGRNPLK